MQVKFSNGFLSDRHQKIIRTGFASHSNDVKAPGYQKDRVNCLAFERNDQLVGALTADILWDWIYIDELWVDRDFRGSGIAKDLMASAEDYAAAHDMTGLWLWTQGWQAAEFYEKRGYIEFTRFDDFPKGHQRIGFRKQLLIKKNSLSSG